MEQNVSIQRITVHQFLEALERDKKHRVVVDLPAEVYTRFQLVSNWNGSTPARCAEVLIRQYCMDETYAG